MTQKALKIPEIVRIICDEIYEQHSIGENPSLSSLLASTARVSPLFAIECLARLWSSQYSLSNFLGLLPRECYMMNGSNVETMDFERPMLYAPWIKHMQCKSLPPATVCDALSHNTVHGVMLPLLRSLHYDVSSTEHATLPYISLFLASSLGTLHLTAHGDSMSFLTTYGGRCPNLTEFSMFTAKPYAPTNTSSAFNSFLGHLTQIHTIDVDSMVCVSFGQLAVLPTLHTLVIRENDRCKFQLSGLWCFAALSDLQLHFSSFKTMGRMLKAMDAPQLTSIQMDSVFYARADVIRAIFQRFQQHLRSKQLHEIRIDTDPETVPNDFSNHDAITLQTIEPLLSFTSLTHADIRLNAGFELSDRCIASVAEAWPLIETLRLTLPYDARHAVASSITIAGLRTFACNCPCLDTLGLSLDGSVEPPKVKPIDVFAHQDRLRILEVGISVVQYPERVADFLSTVFPALAKIETYWECSDIIQDEFDSVSAWNFVETQLKFGVKVCMRERLLGQMHGSSLPVLREDSD
ncbi:hypothetical protein B0H16DRAFT_1460668 [Mycena metata]|uniref:F-box domain-containing protein n=1 Tax=Mycena metata TaxID=1033252 RepID=A0AAD7N8T1_9AGAR|nr:hypothetical protein B0H16DRAFT_1460668 [Mycena metata]